MDRRQRVNMTSGSVITELQRQKSIYKNLNWQIRQRDKKINFLERYFSDLQRVINKEQLDDEILTKKAEQQRKKVYSYPYRYPTEADKEEVPNVHKKRIATQMMHRDESLAPNRSAIIALEK